MKEKSAPERYFQVMPLAPGLVKIPRNSCQLLDFSVLVLRAGEEFSFETGEREVCLDVMNGRVDVEAGSAKFLGVGGRKDVFSGLPHGVYAGCRTPVKVIAVEDTEIALGSCPSSTEIPAYVIRPEQVPTGTWGDGNTERSFRYLVNADRPSERMWFAEVTVEDGRWATFPPHKHEDVPGDLFQEEMYYYRVDPVRGFGFCASFGGKVGADHGFMIRDSTLHLMPDGYHTVTSAPGCRICYLALYAGRDKNHRPSPHPDHVDFKRGTKR